MFSQVGEHFVVILVFYPCDLEWSVVGSIVQKATNHFNKFVFNRKPAIVVRSCLIPAGLQVGLGQNSSSNGYLSLISGKKFSLTLQILHIASR